MRKPVRTERARNRLAAAVAAVLGAAWLVASPAAPQPAEALTSSESRMAAEIVSQINAERAARGLSQLGVDASLRSRAQTIAEANRADNCHACHSSSLGDGEVVQWSGGPGASGRSTVAWMVSTAHRDILMSPGLTAIGVGLACHPDGGQEAVGRVSGQVTPGAPASPVVTSRQSGSRCDNVGTTTTKPPLTLPPTTSGGNSSVQHGSAEPAPPSGPAPTAAPGGAAAPGATRTTTTQRASPKGAGRSPTTVSTGRIAADEELIDLLATTTTTSKTPATTTTEPEEDGAEEDGAEARALDDVPISGPGLGPGAMLAGFALVATFGGVVWRNHRTWVNWVLRR